MSSTLSPLAARPSTLAAGPSLPPSDKPFALTLDLIDSQSDPLGPGGDGGALPGNDSFGDPITGLGQSNGQTRDALLKSPPR